MRRSSVSDCGIPWGGPVCWDNALAESFFASLKNERGHGMVYPTRKKAKEDIARYIELFYNRRRIHSALGGSTAMNVDGLTCGMGVGV
jgi:transposase InsO family protein